MGLLWLFVYCGWFRSLKNKRYDKANIEDDIMLILKLYTLWNGILHGVCARWQLHITSQGHYILNQNWEGQGVLLLFDQKKQYPLKFEVGLVRSSRRLEKLTPHFYHVCPAFIVHRPFNFQRMSSFSFYFIRNSYEFSLQLSHHPWSLFHRQHHQMFIFSRLKNLHFDSSFTGVGFLRSNS